MTIASEDIMQDIDNPSTERLIIKVNGVYSLSYVNPIIEEKEKEEWIWESDTLEGQSAYIIFTRPAKTNVEWYGKMIDNKPLVINDWTDIPFANNYDDCWTREDEILYCEWRRVQGYIE